jgi:hypothetical protein
MEINSQETSQGCQQVFEEFPLHSEHSYLFALSSSFNWTLGSYGFVCILHKKEAHSPTNAV